MNDSKKKEIRRAVLVVDDDPLALKSFVIGLGMEGYDVAGAVSGREALSLLSQRAFAVLLADLMMPEMNGLALAREVRRLHPDVITILMSAYALSPVQLAKADAGVVGFVPKPCRIEQVAEFIDRKVGSPGIRRRVTLGAASALGKARPIDVASFSLASLLSSF